MVRVNWGGRVTIFLTHEDLAQLAGISRETVTRMLGRLQREKLIEIPWFIYCHSLARAPYKGLANLCMRLGDELYRKT